MIALEILKIIAIVIACAAVLAVAALCLVLFAPVRYKATLTGEGSDITAEARAGWLFGLLSVRARLSSGGVRVKIKLAGATLVGEGSKARPEKKKPPKKEDGTESFALRMFKRHYLGIKTSPDDKESFKEPKESSEGGRSPEEARGEPAGFFASLSRKVREILEKIKTLRKKAGTVKYIACAPVTKRALRHLEKSTLRFLGRLKPKSVKGTFTFGTGDPAQTAQIYAVAGICECMAGWGLTVIPNMEDKIIRPDLTIKGRFFAIYVLSFLWSLLTNRDIRRVAGYIGRNL